MVAGGFAPRQKPDAQVVACSQEEACQQPSILLFKRGGKTAPSVITGMMAGDSWGAGGDMEVDLTEKVGL